MNEIITTAGQQPEIRKPYVLLVCMVASLGGFLFGYYINVVIGALIFLTRHFHLTPMQLGFAVASATLGCAAGAMIGGYVTDRIGRKKTLALTAVIFAIGGIGTALPA